MTKTKTGARERYTTIAGETIEFDAPAPELARFLARVTAAAQDPTISQQELTELIYGAGNPLLEQGLFPGRGAVTKAVFANPLYHVMLDLLDLKRVQVGTLEPERAAARYTMTVTEAAAEIDVTPGAVRQAIGAGHLAAWKKGGRYLLDPGSVATYRDRVTRRGPRAAPALRVRFGSKPGASLRVKVPELEAVDEERDGERRVIVGEVKTFAGSVMAAVSISGARMNRTLILEPSDDEDRFDFEDDFGIEGRYRVTAKFNNAKEAAAAFRCGSADGGSWFFRVEGAAAPCWVSASCFDHARELASGEGEVVGDVRLAVDAPKAVRGVFAAKPAPHRVLLAAEDRQSRPA